MNRRDFVSRVVLGGAAAACTEFGTPAFAAPRAGSFKFRFVGMMAFIERQDRSFLVATPGQSHHHAAHVPFLMARADSVFAKALKMIPVAGVVPEAFDTELTGTRSSDFVYRSLENTAIEVIAGGDPVANAATQMAHLHRIAPGKRVRGNVEKWASATISLRGGSLQNSSAHPDAGRVWSFGSHRQQVTDAVNYYNAPSAATTIRLTSGTDVVTATVDAGQAAELSMISAAAFAARMNNPVRLVHSGILFEYLVDAQPVIAECEDATGREVPPTRLPFATPGTASLGVVGKEAAFPPATDFCYICDILLGGSGS